MTKSDMIDIIIKHTLEARNYSSKAWKNYNKNPSENNSSESNKAIYNYLSFYELCIDLGLEDALKAEFKDNE